MNLSINKYFFCAKIRNDINIQMEYEFRIISHIETTYFITFFVLFYQLFTGRAKFLVFA